MDPRERIALWVALIVLLVFVLVRSSSSFVGAQMSFVDLAEFDTLPADLKKVYYDTMVNGVAKEAGKKVTDMWAALTPAQKEEAKAQATKQAKMVVDQIQSGKGGVMVLPPPTKQESAMKPMQEPVKVQGKIAEPVQNWMPIAQPVQMQGKIAEVKPAQMQMEKAFATPNLSVIPPLVQGGKIAEVKPLWPQQMQGKIDEPVKPVQGKIAEVKSFGPAQDFGKAFEKKM